MKERHFYEIEMKAHLTKEKYDSLSKELPLKLKQINIETIHTTRYRPGDIRLRYSDKKAELVCKEGDPTKISRKEVIINLQSKENIDKFTEVLKMLNFKSDPPWLKHKQEFEYNLNGYDYNVCLQNIEKFAYLLEVEFLSEKEEPDLHIENLKTIIRGLDCEPINPEDFTKKINQYIQLNQ